MSLSNKKPKPATGQEIRSILGPVDDELVTTIMEIGATHKEVLQALEWLDDDDYMGRQLGKSMDISVARVHKILQRDREQLDEHER